jgi:thiamine biosynthesis lipoprotein
MMLSAVEDQATGDVALALEAMATRFELVLGGSDPVRLRAAGEEALAEIARLEGQLSFYLPTSDITWINAHAAHGPVKVEPALFRFLQKCQALSAATDGAFDITIAPLMRAWRAAMVSGVLPSETSVASARARVGFRNLHLNPGHFTAQFGCHGMSIDLGAAGKGFAIDAAIGILRAHGVPRALLHGGTSSVHVIGSPASGPGWRVGWDPPGGTSRAFNLHNSALSVSAVHGRRFSIDGVQYGHVIDPRTGMPTRGARSVIVSGPGSLECDALSTALLVLGPGWLPSLHTQFPGYDGIAE